MDRHYERMSLCVSMQAKKAKDNLLMEYQRNGRKGVCQSINFDSIITLKLKVDFTNQIDIAEFII